MDSTTDTSYTATSMAFREERRTVVREPATPSVTDTMNAQAIAQLLTDIALTQRATVRLYARKRYALRKLVELGVFTPAEARARKSPVVNLLTKWRTLRLMRRELTT